MPDSPLPAPGHDLAAAGGPFRPRVDPPLSPAFAKDPADERFVEDLNAALAPMEDAGYRDLPETRPTLHIVGAPRSGTTLLYQVIAGALDVGYIDNLTAAFWRTPVTGLRLSRKVGVAPSTGFGSDFGRTSGVGEPHEFGYFWNHHLAYPDLSERGTDHERGIDWDRLRRVIVNMAEARGAPMVFKPMLLIWHMDAMVRAMPRTCFVWIHRDPRDTALSILRMRLAVRGRLDEWASLRPSAAHGETDPHRQVAMQVLLLERTIRAAAARLGPATVLPVRYERLCAEPNAVIADIRDLMGAKGEAPGVRVADLPAFAPGPSRGLEEHGERIDAALAEVGAELSDTEAGVRA
jgi:hypothetical protein